MPYTTSEQAPDSPERALPTAPPAQTPEDSEPRGCLYALSQPPLLLFLTVIGALLLIAGAHDQFLL
ncbi:hypothetical protein [Streptomyces hoynatensis]|uniref:Uncharacterized protein n=1 Tax=Streptomyces hoynatensis TaxID=1141874 RepID=A0A3A9Z8E9_9ACTN|nr:hypothetical protein [Streptomyces hoynatensis]RKN44671.1 hypothetical protein D7294_05905 [Streptomyces hoynatensis]